ncbi:histidine phosphotransferase family protein [Ovoidimarina sediminis]|uniref:histidine phosphotransferase family protein n=1 Tax=Ovoidimarina sediminis TaxID=3079856 RepID=UPI0029319652|nr:histidine phosphotransferase family protein [Rhodophyticola sp. MJ-SS7]
MSGMGATPEIALISESVEHANARIRLFRIAYGAAPGGATVPRAEVIDIVTGLGRSGRLRFDWRIEGDLPRALVKIAFLALQCFETEMPFGGVIEARLDGASWVIEGRAERRRAESQLWSILHDPQSEAEISPANVHFALLPLAAADSSVSLHLETTDHTVRLTFEAIGRP